MELKLALDVVTAEKGLAVAKSVADLLDLLELGTPFVYTHPIAIIRQAKGAFPGVRILADYKIMDGGDIIARMAFDAGADITTVFARTWDDTIEEVIAAARSMGRRVLVDMMGVPEAEIARRGHEIEALGGGLYLYAPRRQRQGIGQPRRAASDAQERCLQGKSRCRGRHYAGDSRQGRPLQTGSRHSRQRYHPRFGSARHGNGNA
jgi:hypothetical protein